MAILRGEESAEHFIKIGINDSPKVNARITAGPSGKNVTVSDRGINNPRDYDAFMAEFDRARRTNSLQESSMQVSFHRDCHLAQRARVGWLRAGYMIAFAAFGYRYACGPALDRVREQIARFDEELIPAFAGIVPDADRGTRNLASSNAKSEFPAVIVQFGWHVVVLPHHTDVDFYDRYWQYAQGHSAQSQWGGQAYEWPRRPLYGGDQQDRPVHYET